MKVMQDIYEESEKVVSRSGVGVTDGFKEGVTLQQGQRVLNVELLGRRRSGGCEG